MGNPVRMDSATYGVTRGMPGYYNVLVYDSVKFTNSGTNCPVTLRWRA
jgi:hypothetical protein